MTEDKKDTEEKPYPHPRWNQAIPPRVVGAFEMTDELKEEAEKCLEILKKQLLRNKISNTIKSWIHSQLKED